MFISVTCIATLIRFVTTSLVCKNKNKGDKLHHRKSMRAADEKLIRFAALYGYTPVSDPSDTRLYCTVYQVHLKLLLSTTIASKVKGQRSGN